jgi:hypothetical protein
MTRRAIVLSSWLAVVSAGLSWSATAIDDELARKARAWGSVRVRLEARLASDRPGREPAVSDLVIHRAGADRIRVDFLSPERDRGKVLLQTKEGSWLWLPRAERLLEVPVGRNPLAGGALFEGLFASELAGGEGAIETVGEDLVWTRRGPGEKGETRTWIRRSTLVPFRREIIAPSGRVTSTIHIDETRPWNGVEIPWRLRYVDHLRGDLETRVEIRRVEKLEGDASALFSKESLRGTPR